MNITKYLALFLVLYRQGMTGIVLLLGVCAAVFFVVSIRFGATPIVDSIPGENLGMFAIMIMAVVIALSMVYFYYKDKTLVKTISILGVSLFAVGIIVYNYLDVKSAP